MISVARWFALAGLLAALAGVAPAPASAASRLPSCPTGRASTKPPTAPAGASTSRACRAKTTRTPESSVRSTPSGYHHLGAGTSGEWSGVTGRLQVVDAAVRRNSYDFVANRFLAKRDRGNGRIAWLEAGWAETGWSGNGRQRIYTYDTNTGSWQFYDQYRLRPGDRLWMDVHTDAQGLWQAWLWWNNRWNLLTAQKLPIGTTGQIEQYVEVHVDASRATRVKVPPVRVDNVQLRDASGARYWRSDVATRTAAVPRASTFCLNWITRYDTWTAGDCR